MLHEKIRTLRKGENLKIKDMAELTGFSISYISQIETGKVEPSISILRRFASIFKVPITDFFEPASHQQILVRKSDRKKIGTNRSSIVYELLSPNLNNKKMQVAIIKLSPNFKDPENLFLSHSGQECILVIKNELVFIHGKTKYFLNEGDSVYFDGSKPYRIENPSDTETIILGAITPPLI